MESDGLGRMEVRSIPGYELREEIGRGGMGIVYRARDFGFERDVAVKLLADHLCEDNAAVTRFRNEVRITGQLQHPGIPPAHEVGSLADGKPFLAMKLVKGQTLQGLLEDRASPDADRGRFVGIFEQICNAVGYAHAHRVIHRDLKPVNVMVGKFGEVQVMDWGLAKLLGDEPTGASSTERLEVASTVALPRSVVDTPRGAPTATRTGSILGTPAYMSPEQAGGEIRRLSERSDVFSLGAILCQILTGQPPYIGGTANDLRVNAVRGELRDAFERLDNCEAEPSLVSLTKRCLSFEQQDRPANGLEVSEEVARIRAESESRARQAELERNAAVVRTSEEVKRRQQFLIGTGAIGTMLLLGILGTSYGLLREKRASTAETKAKDEARKRQKQAEDAATAERIAKEDAKKERARAEQRESIAIEALKRFGDVVSQNPDLRNSPELEPLRKDLLKEPLEFFKSLREQLQSDKSTRPESLLKLASAASDLGNLTDAIGNRQEALHIMQESLSLWKQLAGANPAVTEYRREQALIHVSLGSILQEIGQNDEALAAFKEAVRIQDQLVREKPLVLKYQRDLAKSHNEYGQFLYEAGRAADALAINQEAKRIQEKLVREDQQMTEYLDDLASTYTNIFLALSILDQPAKAIEALEEATRLQELVVDKEPEVEKYQHALSMSHFNLGIQFRRSGQRDKAPSAFQKAIEVQEKLVRNNFSVTRYRLSLAFSYLQLGIELRDTGQRVEAWAAFEEAKKIQDKLVLDNRNVAVFHSDLGATLNEMAMLKIREGNFAYARDLAREAVDHQKLAVAAKPQHPYYREFLNNHYRVILLAAKGLNDEVLKAEAERGLAELDASDPQLIALDKRLTAVVEGEAVKDTAELLALGQRAYDKGAFFLAVRFFGEAMEREMILSEDRQKRVAYDAACSAALAASGAGASDPPLDDAAKEKLRGRALGWLRSELSEWEKFLEKPEAWPVIARTMEHWQQDADLASVREAEKLAVLSEGEWREWEALWARVKEMLEKAQSGLKAK